METAMEQRNVTASLASYGQDTGDFGPETDVDTPDEQIDSSKPKGRTCFKISISLNDL